VREKEKGHSIAAMSFQTDAKAKQKGRARKNERKTEEE
jgi:hypothetical protein